MPRELKGDIIAIVIDRAAIDIMRRSEATDVRTRSNLMMLAGSLAVRSTATASRDYSMVTMKAAK